jgi:hypothetical protein
VEFLYGAMPRPEWLSLGGDLRFLQLFQDTPTVREARVIVMQMDLEAAATVGKLTLNATIGRDDPTSRGVTDPGFTDYLISRRHYALYQLTDEWHLLAGRSPKPFGILDPNHTSTTKKGLGWDFGTEPYLVQAGYSGELVQAVAYGSFGRFGDVSAGIEKGGGLTGSLGLGGRHKVGASYFYGTTEPQNRHVFGPWALLGFTERFYLRAEHDLFRTEARSSGKATWGYGDNMRLGYEIVQGVHGFAEQQYLQTDFDQASGRKQVYGVGVLYYPRPHWEFELDLQQRKTGTQSFTTYVYALLHYYL